MTEQSVNHEQTLDLLGQLMVRGRRWEYAVVVMLIVGTFTAGVTVQKFRAQFASQADTLVTIQRGFEALVIDLNSRTAERHANEAAATMLNTAQDKAINDLTANLRILSDTVLHMAKTAEEHEAEDRRREQHLVEMGTTITKLTGNQESAIRLLDRITDDVERLKDGPQ